jgi:hypothetical protein
MPANLRTFAAAYASLAVKHDFGVEGLAFGIVAPDTGQGAALEKYSGAYTWPIVDRISLNVE